MKTFNSLKPMTRGVLAKACGIHAETLRYYEREALIPQPERSESGYRYYAPEMVERILFIKRAQALGFTLTEIKDILSMKENPSAERKDLRERLKGKIDQLKSKMADLEHMHHSLSELLEQCTEDGSLEGCPIMANLDNSNEKECCSHE